MNRFVWVAILGILALLAASGMSGAGAWFADADTSVNNTVTTGTLGFQVSGDRLKLTGIKPGEDYRPLGTFCTRSTGTTELKFRALFEANDATLSDWLSFFNVRVEQQVGDEWDTLTEIPGRAEEPQKRLYAYFKFPNQPPENVYPYALVGNLTPGQETCYRLSARLEPDAPAALQDQSFDFSLHLFATQTDNAGWE